MKRGFLFLMPLALAAIVFAQGTEDAAALVKKLGSEDYAAREEAQKKLVAMGEKAVPALEEALKSDDLEVRLRAGRALRAIGAEAKKADEPAQPAPDQPPARAGQVRGKVSVTITEMVDGKLETKTYEGASLEELTEKHPELKAHLGGGRFQLRVGGPGDFDMDMDKFWSDWNRDFDGFDEDIRKWQDDARRQFDEMRRWMDRARPQRARPDAGVTLTLGVRAYRPPAVLDAQLDLRGRGLVIEAVEKGSLGDRLGLERFDVLTELNGKEIDGADDVALALHGLGDAKATAKVVRRAEPLVLNEAAAAAPR
jgi:hypothetical protein